jgi:hypothetical protein
MACEALAALGSGVAIDDWVPRFEASMQGARVVPTTPRWSRRWDWKDHLGDHRLLPSWLGYFDRAIAEEGWRAVVGVWGPRLVPGLAAALFHGVIRTSHAVRAIDGADTPARRAELARALGNWAVWFGPGQPAAEVNRVDDPHAVAVEAAAEGAGSYVTAPSIFYLHGVTAAMAVDLVSRYFSPADGALAAAQLKGEHRALYRAVTPPADGFGVDGWDDEVAVAAITSYDPHQVKLVEACHRGFETTGDARFVAAAQTVTSGRR